MTEHDLARLETLEKAATPGPWEVRAANGRPAIWRKGCKVADVEAPDSPPYCKKEGRRADAEFITALRNAAPWLIERAKRADKAEQLQRAALTADAGKRLADVVQAAEQLAKNLPDTEIQLAREAWGNTNARIVEDAMTELRKRLAALEGGQDG